MERRQFLESIGIGAAFALTATCLQSCKSDEGSTVTPSTSGVDFTLNLDDAANSGLKTNGGFVIKNGVVVARTNTGSYVAASQTCSHEGQVKVSFNSSGNKFACSAHGAEFDTTGKPLNSVTSKNLTVYKTTLTGTSLRITA